MARDQRTPIPSNPAQDELRLAIENASPLALPGLLHQAEFYDREEAINILNSVYAEFEDPDRAVQELGSLIITGFVEGALHPLRKGGILSESMNVSGTQIVGEIKSYRAFLKSPGTHEDTGASEHVLSRRPNAPNDKLATAPYKRSKVEDKKAMDAYKSHRFQGKKTVKDDYGSGRSLRAKQNEAKQDKRINPENWHRHAAESDHRVPLKEVDVRMQAFGYCDEGAIKGIANMDSNLAITDKATNTSKGAKSAREIASDNPAMMDLDNKARNAISLQALGAGSKSVAMNEMARFALAVIVPVGGEILDITTVGVRGAGMAALNAVDCLLVRMGRIKEYVVTRLADFAGSFFTEAIKMLIRLAMSMMVKAITGTIQLVCKSVGFVVEGLKILFNPSKMTTTQKCQAFVSLVGGTLVAMLIDVPGGDSNILVGFIKALLGGIVAGLLMYLLNELDLFSDVAERRLARINEIFDERVRVMKSAASSFELVASQKLKEQRLRFENLRATLGGAITSGDYQTLNETLDGVADFLEVDVPYSSPEEFVTLLRRDGMMTIGSA